MLLDEVAYVNRHTESSMGRAMTGIEWEVEQVNEVVVEHTTLVAEAQGDIETLIADARRKMEQIDRLQILVDKLLTRITVLEGHAEHPIEIPDSPTPLPVCILVDDAHHLVPIEELVPDSEGEEEGVNLDEVFQVNPDLEEVYRVRPGEEYADGETILDVLWRRNVRAKEVPEYEEPPQYNDLGYVSNHN